MTKSQKHVVNNKTKKTKKINIQNTNKLHVKNFNYFKNKIKNKITNIINNSSKKYYKHSNIILNETATYITKLIVYKDSKEADYAKKYLLKNNNDNDNDKNKLQQTKLFYAIKNEYTKFQNKITTQNHVEKKKLNFTLNEDFPSSKIIYQVIHNSYIIHNKDKVIYNFNLIYSTNTLVFYKKDNIIIVGVRGTADARDVRADLLLPLGLLNKSERYIEDFNVMKKIHQEYKYNENIFYGVAHSLGSTLIDRFLQESLLTQAISFNPAVEKGYFNNTNNKRIYIESDPLYKTMGKYANNIEVIKKPNKMLNKTLSNSAITNFKSNVLSSHALTNFNDLLIE